MGFWDGSTPAMRVCFSGFCGAASAVLIRLIAEWLQSDVLAYVSVGMMVVSVGVGFWAVWFGRHLS
jgi:hypothetical protein